jgi:hypothetical protein
MQTPAITRWSPKQYLLGFFILEKQLASQNRLRPEKITSKKKKAQSSGQTIMQTPAIMHWFHKQEYLLGFFILEKQLASQNMFRQEKITSGKKQGTVVWPDNKANTVNHVLIS